MNRHRLMLPRRNERKESKYSNEIHRARRCSWIAFYRMAAGKGQMLVVNGLCGSQSGTRHDPPLGCLKFVYETKDRRISPEMREREIVRMKKKRAQYFTRVIQQSLSHRIISSRRSFTIVLRVPKCLVNFRIKSLLRKEEKFNGEINTYSVSRFLTRHLHWRFPL